MVNTLISYFKYVPQVRVLLITFNKGGMGLNLQIANHEMFLTSSLRYTEVRQARDRVYRNNQKKNVHIHNMTLRIPDIPIHHPYPPTWHKDPRIVVHHPPMAPMEPGEIRNFDETFSDIFPGGHLEWDKSNVHWYHAMYSIAGDIVAVYNSAGLGIDDLRENLKTFFSYFVRAYKYVAQRPLMSAHEIVTKARTDWQAAHALFYPLHRHADAANAEQTQLLGFRLALFKHRLAVLLGSE